jgi:hypothetical protein
MSQTCQHENTETTLTVTLILTLTLTLTRFTVSYLEFFDCAFDIFDIHGFVDLSEDGGL